MAQTGSENLTSHTSPFMFYKYEFFMKQRTESTIIRENDLTILGFYLNFTRVFIFGSNFLESNLKFACLVLRNTLKVS